MVKKQITPVPKMVNVSLDTSDVEVDPSFGGKGLEMGIATPGTMAKTAVFSSPLAIFSEESRAALGLDFDSGTECSVTTQRLGISRPAYSSSDDGTQVSSVSHRIGITRPSYDELAQDQIPLSPLDLYFEKAKTSLATDLQDSEADDSDGGDLVFRRLQEAMLAAHNQAKSDRQVFTPEEEEKVPEDGIGRFLHKQTAEGHYLVNSPSMDAPMNGMRYSLDKGKRSMTPLMRAVSDSRIKAPRTRPNVVRRASTPVLTDAGEPLEASFKIFILLIQPKSRIFELIQVLYSPSETTVGDLLEMIPLNATEPALAAQFYSGLCRPNEGGEIDPTLMASASGVSDCARITRGEIMVAIPEGYPADICAKIAKPILGNPKIGKLLDRSDPLAPKRKRRKSRRKSRKSIAIQETVQEADEETELGSVASMGASSGVTKSSVASKSSKSAEPFKSPVKTPIKSPKKNIETSNMNDAIKRATKAALAANRTADAKPVDRVLPKVNSKGDLSVDNSFMSRGSFDSVSSGFTFNTAGSKRIPRRSPRKKSRRQKRNIMLMRMAATAFACMIGIFLMDTSEEEEDETEKCVNQAMGFLGFLQALLIFFLLIQMQRSMQQGKKSGNNLLFKLSAAWSRYEKQFESIK